ncbi:amino acid transporter heavy chain SLC3A1 [Cloeon dipterum]|uniref:amino acid transporter heavy chain SLC3A1 n=1 Tax=Cloeon dipterum TaxID=197152 RepID=UPI003220138B
MADKKNGLDEEAPPQAPEQEKLLEESQTAVIFSKPSPDATNGDAKIDLGTTGLASAGLKKEELLKFANDPFWVRLRWLLFILFWLTWLAMLVGAIYIVVVAPKCPAPEPRIWAEKGQLVSVDVGADANGFEALLDMLPELKEASVAGVLLNNVLKSDANGIVDYGDVNSKLGNLEQFQLLTSKFYDAGVKVILAININHVSKNHKWFNLSLNATGDYADFFLWKKGGTVQSADGTPEPPNNWLSIPSGSAWQYVAARKQFYYHQHGVDQPDLNLRSANLQKELKKILRTWRGQRISGFLFQDASYLTEDENLANELNDDSPSDATFTDYAFYQHTNTKNRDENVQILKIFKDELLSEKDDRENKIVFAADVDGTAEEVTKYYGAERPPVVELPLNRLAKPDVSTAESLRLSVMKYYTSAGENWPNWFLPQEVANPGLVTALALLPGTFIYQPKSDLHNLNSSDIFETIHKVQHERELPSITYGGLDARVFEESVFAYTRSKSGNPGYMILYNAGPGAKNVSAAGFQGVPDILSVVHQTSDESRLPPKSKVSIDNVPVQEKEAIVLTFVPQKN